MSLRTNARTHSLWWMGTSIQVIRWIMTMCRTKESLHIILSLFSVCACFRNPATTSHIFRIKAKTNKKTYTHTHTRKIDYTWNTCMRLLYGLLVVNIIMPMYCDAESIELKMKSTKDTARDTHSQPTLFPFSLQLFVMVFDSNINFRSYRIKNRWVLRRAHVCLRFERNEECRLL